MQQCFRILLSVFLVLPLLVGCQNQMYDDIIATGHLVTSGDSLKIERGMQQLDSLLATNLRPHLFNDSLARRDSSAIAFLYLSKLSYEYYHTHDTVAAALTYFDAQPWLRVASPETRADEARRFAETIGDALVASSSPNMARLAYTAFQEAEQYAWQISNFTLSALVDSSRLALKAQLEGMPDSVRLAFAPLPAPASSPLPAVLVAFVAFIALGTGARGLQVWIRKRQPAHARRVQSSRFVPYDERYSQLKTAERCLEALWVLCYSHGEIPDEVFRIVRERCRNDDSQRALFMAAGLIVLGLDYDPLKAAGVVRQRLLRYVHSHQMAYHPGVILPRDREEARQWLQRHYGIERPAQHVAMNRTGSPLA